MKTKQFQSILAVAVVAASITTNLSPAQAFTWDDLWQSIKRGYENAQPSSSSPQQSNVGGNEPQQSGGFNNDTPQPQIAPQPNNYSAPSSPTTHSPRPRPIRLLQVNCVKANGSALREIGRDDSESMVSVGRSATKVYAKVDIYRGTPYGETCAIQAHPSSGKVALGFAIPDNSNLNDVRVSIYVNGQERISRIMSRGQGRRYVFDVTGASSYAFVLQPLDLDGDIYFPHVRQPTPRQPF